MEIQSGWQEIPGEGAQMSLHVTQPKDKGTYPGILLFHHAPGVNADMMKYAERMAAEGFVCAIPDMYYRWGSQMVFTPTPGNSAIAQAFEYVNQTTDYNLAQDYRTALNFLKGMDSVQPNSIGVVGYCIGGRLSFLAGCLNADVRATVVCYGSDQVDPETTPRRPLPPMDMIPWLQGSMLSLSGDQDQNPSPDMIAQVAAKMKAEGKDYEYHVFPGAGHAFFSEGNKAMYYEPAATAAWPIKLEYLKRKLQA